MQGGKAKSISYTTKEYKDYKKSIIKQLKGLQMIHEDYEYGILLDIKSINRRVGDNDNVAKGIHDALEDGGYIYDDRYALHTMQFKSFGHETNSCTVYLWEIDYTPARRKELERLKLLKTVDEPITITKELLERDKKLYKTSQ